MPRGRKAKPLGVVKKNQIKMLYSKKGATKKKVASQARVSMYRVNQAIPPKRRRKK